MVCYIDFIVIPGKILRLGNKIPIVKPKIRLNWGSAPYILLKLLPGKRMFIVIPGISLNRRSLNRGSIVI